MAFPYLDPRAMAGQGLPNQQSSPRAMTAAASFVPGVGDAIGLLSDASGYVQNPKSLTPLTGLLSLAGVLPFVPAVSKFKPMKRAFASDMMSDFVFDAARYIPDEQIAKGLSKDEWLDLLSGYKAKNPERLPPELSRLRTALKQGMGADELNAYLRSGFSRNPGDAESAWKSLSGVLGITD